MTTHQLTTSLQEGFEEIICYHVDKGELHQRAKNKLRSFINYLLEQTTYTNQRLEEVVKNINYDTIQRDEGANVWPELEFWRGVDDYGSTVLLNYDGNVEDIEEAPVILDRYNYDEMPSDAEMLAASKEAQLGKIDMGQYPVSLLSYYEYRFDETILFYAWIGYLWQEIEGYTCGIKVKTVQNNSIATYCLNDYLDGDFSAFMDSDYSGKPAKLDRFFPRKLSLIELYLRASQTGYPFNPYQNYWRYFEKEDEFMEIVTYEFATGIRSGKKGQQNDSELSQIIQHTSSKAALKYLTEFTNQMIFQGWQEQLRPLDMPPKMHENAFDFEIWTGIHWSKEQTNRLEQQRVRAFEEQFNIQLPKSFFHYLRLLNGRQYNSYNMHFPIDDGYTVHVQKFYTILELEKVAKTALQNDSKYLPIGELEDGKVLGIVIDTNSEQYGQVVMMEDGNTELCDYSFEKFAKYAQSNPKQAEIFAAEENDANFLKQRLQAGWDYNTTYDYQNAVTQAANHNSHEALEVLLKAGARLRDNNHRDAPHVYDERTMELLDRYQR